MSFLDKIKDMNEMRKQAGQIQSMLSQEKIMGQSRDAHFRVFIDGNQNVLNVEIDQELLADKFASEKSAKEAFADALDKLKKLMVSKFSGMLGQ